MYGSDKIIPHKHHVVILLNALLETSREVKNAIKYGCDKLYLETVINSLRSRDLESKSEVKSESLIVRGRIQF